MSIRRYEQRIDGVIESHPVGEYVKYDDHKAKVEALEARISAMEKDAEQAAMYRWVREHVMDRGSGLATINFGIEYHGAEGFDKDVRAAIAKEKT